MSAKRASSWSENFIVQSSHFQFPDGGENSFRAPRAASAANHTNR